ncbi:putative F-box family protein [Melia azedarach]|uniref:F-box family protein n=1 Tax=Melia azedarach TaxID=155640 RepID=A0ACC1WVY5_MELAZ|nr:putative F-box family protein [Melia azedarach]
MALGKKCSSLKPKRGVASGEDVLGLGFVRYNRGLGRKRILITNVVETSSFDSAIRTPLKRQCSDKMVDLDCDERSRLEALPQDILIRILCSVNHEDLKQLFHVSKPIREATLIAKECHFAYSTPRKSRVFGSSIDFEGPNEDDEVEAPNAPRQMRGYKSRISGKKLADLSVALFASPQKGLFMEE